MKKTFIILASILTAAGVALIICALFACGFDLDGFGGSKTEINEYTVNESFDSIEICGKEADVILKPSEDGTFKAVCGESEKIGFTVSVQNGTLRISCDDRREWYDFISFLFPGDTSVTVYLPSDSYGSLQIENGTGDVTVPSDFTFGNVDISASTGKVICCASSSGLFRVKTDTGNVRLDGINAKEADLASATGNIVASAVRCEGGISIKVSTGNVDLSDVECGGLTTEGSTGRVTLKNVTAEGGFNIKRSTGNVRFESCDAESVTVKTSTGNVTGSFLSAKVFVTHSSTGRIDVPDTASGGRCEVTTSTGNIILTVDG